MKPWILGLLCLVVATGADTGDHQDDKGCSCSKKATEGTCPPVVKTAAVATGATCPTGSTVKYDPDVRTFMSKYCTQCHSSQLSGEARRCAPAFHDFDSEKGILDVAAHVSEYAAAGPKGANTRMPPQGYPQPSDAERKMLGEWLACKTMATGHGGAGGTGGIGGAGSTGGGGSK
jgi:hypothetical protein